MEEKSLKTVEFDSFHVYVLIMRKMLLNNLGLLLSVGILLAPTAGMASSSVSALLKFSPQADFPARLQALKKQGVRIQQAAAPHLAIAELPVDFSPSQISGLEAHHLGPVELDSFLPLGPLAVALVQRWNNSLLSEGSEDSGLLGAMSTLIRSNTLPKPEAVRLSPNGRILEYELAPILTADIYECELSPDPGFASPAIKTLVRKPSGTLPIPNEIEGNFYFRARALEKDRREEHELFLQTGDWSAPSEVAFAQTPWNADQVQPVPTSPLPGQEMEGFTVILEWAVHSAGQFRVQFSENNSFQETVIDRLTEERSFTIPALAMEVNKTYHWRVAPWDGSTGPWSEVRSLTIREPRHFGADTFVNPEAPR